MQGKALRYEDPDPEPFARWRTGSGSRRWRLPQVVVAVVLTGCGSTGESLASAEIEAPLAVANDPTTTIAASQPTMPATIVLPLPVPAETTATTQPTAEAATADAATTPPASSTTPSTAAATTPPTTAAPTTPTTAPATSPTMAPTSETMSPSTTQVVPPSSPSETSPDVAVPEIVEFRIAPGTGSGPWNTFENAVRIRLGQTLRVHNDDSVAHTIHANGAPFPHGSRIAPGSFRDHLVVRPSEPSAGSPRLYEHTAGRSAAFYVIATS
ncbi:MAG: hypothetical protein ACR2QO_07940 [Acidimicrobiales bacterium]